MILFYEATLHRFLHDTFRETMSPELGVLQESWLQCPFCPAWKRGQKGCLPGPALWNQSEDGKRLGVVISIHSCS